MDDISFGIELKRKLDRYFKDGIGDDGKQNKRVVMLSSDHNENEENVNEVDDVINENIFKAKVIISTSVMDNGIDIKDPKLRNMIVISDNEVGSIQMVGRKRRDEQRSRSYMIRQSRDFFAKWQRQVQRRLKIAEEYRMEIEKGIRGISSCAGGEGDLSEIDRLEEKLVWQHHIYAKDCR